MTFLKKAIASGVLIAALCGLPAVALGQASTSSRVQLVDRVMQTKVWTQFAQGNRLCLANFGIANITRWLTPDERPRLYQLIGAHGEDIRALQQMLGNCRNGQTRAIDINSVIAVDVRPDGMIVIMTI